MALSPTDLLLTTFRDLTGSWIRTGLTTLGIFMGVAAVNATLNIDAVTTAQIEAKLAQLDNPYVSYWMFDPTRTKPRPELSTADYVALQREVTGVLGISQITELGGISEVRYQANVATQVNVEGVSLNFQETTGRKILTGRFFQRSDFEQYYPVAIINTVLAEQLFSAGESPLNQGIFLGTVRLTVIGVTETKQFRIEREPTPEIWVTQNYANAIAGSFTWSNTQIAIRELENYATVEEGVEAFLRQRHPGFEVRIFGNAKSLYKEEQQQRTSARILKVVGLLALVIGGVGIANITVAAVMERTREIGLRRAIGATDWEVMLQFITEAALLSVMGGTLAIAAIHGLTQVVTTQVFEAPYQFRPQDAAISMGAAFVVGVGASFFPALRVTQIDVVQALKGE